MESTTDVKNSFETLMKQIYSDDFAKLLIRLAVGGLMLFHGIHKLVNGHGHIESWLANSWLPAFLVYGVPLGEVVAPLLILFGFKTRLAALVEAFTMLISIYWLSDAMGTIFQLTKYGGWAIELNAFFLFASLALFFSGPGKYSLSRGKGLWD